MASISCPHCGQTFEASTGKTAAIRAFTRDYMSTHPGATVNAVALAYLAANPTANINTVMTQVRAAR